MSYVKNIEAPIFFLFVDASSGAAITAAAPTATYVVDNSVEGDVGGTWSHLGAGRWRCTASAGVFNGNVISIVASATGAVPQHLLILTDRNVDSSANFTVSALANVWEVVRANHASAGTFGEVVTEASIAAAAASATWSTSSGNYTGTGTFGRVMTRVDTSISNVGAADTSAVASAVWSISAGNYVGTGTMGLFMSRNDVSVQNVGTSLAAAIASTSAALATNLTSIGAQIASTSAGLSTLINLVSVATSLTRVDVSTSRVILVSAVASVGQTVIDASAGLATNITSVAARLSNKPTKNASMDFPFLMVDVSGSAVAGLSPSVLRSIDRGAFAAGSIGAVVSLGGGMYSVSLAASDMNGNIIIISTSAATAQTKFYSIFTQPS